MPADQDHDALTFCEFARAAGLRTISHLQAFLNFSDGEVRTVSDIATAIGETIQNTNYILANLVQIGLLTRDEKTRPALYSVTEEGLQHCQLILFGEAADAA